VLLGRKPTPEDLHAMAVQFHSSFAVLIRGDQNQLENMLLSVFLMASDNQQVKGGMGVVVGTAALGVLLDDPESELAVMPPPLMQWWLRNRDDFRELESNA
jgi:hypothetical protein